VTSRRAAGADPERDKRIRDLAAKAADPAYREIAARLLPLTDEQREQLSLLLHPGARNDRA
jgi:hypothetical protein